MKKQILNEEFLRMQKLAGLITESEFKRQVIKEMKMFDLKDKNGKPTELFKIENFSSVEDAIDMLNKYYGMGENEVDSFYTDETGTDYNYAYVANDGYTRFVKSLDEFSDGYQTEEEWGVASEEEIMNESKLNESYIIKDENEKILIKGETEDEVYSQLKDIINQDPETWDYKITDDGKLLDPLDHDALLSNNAKQYLMDLLNGDGIGGTWVIEKI
jgi:hypothetical protein